MPFERLLNLSRWLVLICLWMLLAAGELAAQKRSHEVFFEGSDHELHVFKIIGKAPGRTLMLIGGIQGDEPGGFMAADDYVDLSLARGNLIVVPRANFHSIVLNRRQINHDMNRTFSETVSASFEVEVVAILKRLMGESDCLLNLHEGSGFFSPDWQAPDRNPMKFGQSIIADSEELTHPESGRQIKLGEMARTVSAAINIQILDPGLHFHFNNHRTGDEASLHPEQRRSATYYALYRCGIPAFGIETNRALPLETRVYYHTLAINQFMALLEILPETPGVRIEAPELDYLVVAVNGSLPVVVRNGQRLILQSGDSIQISHIEANYERGLSVDIVGYGGLNDLRKPIAIREPTRIIVRKDHTAFGTVDLAVEGEMPPARPAVEVSDRPHPTPAILGFKVEINGRAQTLDNGSHARLRQGDTFRVVDVMSASIHSANLKVNFKGFAGAADYNSGEDRGCLIRIDRDLMPRFSTRRDGRQYQVVVLYETHEVGRLLVDIEGPISGRP